MKSGSWVKFTKENMVKKKGKITTFFSFANFHPENHSIEKKRYNQFQSKLKENSKNGIENFVTHCFDIIMTS